MAILRGPLLNPFEMQSYEPLQDEFDLVALAPHQTQFDVSVISMPKESIQCPIANKVLFEREKRKFQAAKDFFTGDTFSFCGMRDRLHDFDIYHIKDQSFCFSYEAALAKKRFGGKLVVTQMENMPHMGERKFMERHIKNTVREQADLFLAASEGAYETLLEEGVSPLKIQRISNAINTAHFSPGKPDVELRRSLSIPDDAFLIIYVGRLHADKGIFTLLEAMKSLRKETRIHLLMVGKDEQNVNAWIKINGLSKVIHTVGFVSYDVIPFYYRLAQVSVLPSLPARRWKEQFGYVIIEAMACGLPVVGSDSGAIPEVVGDPKMIFPAGSAQELANILKELSRRSLRAAQIRSRKRAVELYSAKVLTSNLRLAYRHVLGIHVLPSTKRQEGSTKSTG